MVNTACYRRMVRIQRYTAQTSFLSYKFISIKIEAVGLIFVPVFLSVKLLGNINFAELRRDADLRLE